MNIDHILKQVLDMRPCSFSAREQQRYRAEKMLMRQFVLMKLQYQVPIYLHSNDMKKWLLGGRSFLEEFQDVANGAETRQLLMAELVWTSARRLCVNQMEQEVWEELAKEQRLSLQFRRKVTLEGLQMFLSVIRPKAEKDVQTLLRHLSNKLLSSFAGSHTSKRSKLALLAKLQRTTAPLAPQVVQTALEFLADEPEPLVEVRTSQTLGLIKRPGAASAQVGRQLAEAAATCFCLNTSFTKAHIQCMCTLAAWDMVKAVDRRLVDRSKTFHLMDFDESFVTARESVVCAVQDMNDRAQRVAHSWALQQLEENPKAPDVCLVGAERSDEKEDKEEKRGLRPFLNQMWRKIRRVSNDEQLFISRSSDNPTAHDQLSTKQQADTVSNELVNMVEQ